MVHVPRYLGILGIASVMWLCFPAMYLLVQIKDIRKCRHLLNF